MTVAPATASTGCIVRRLLDSGRLDLPRPATGSSRDRFRTLLSIARDHPLGVARLAEAHTDAVAILTEAGHVPRAGALYGVWASQTGAPGLDWDPRSLRLNGTTGFASGLGIVDRALVTVRSPDGPVLLDIAVPLEGDDTVTFSTDSWSTSALADTKTGAVAFHDRVVQSGSMDGGSMDGATTIGPPGWYLSRVGFWHGAIAPAACWAGGAIGLVDAAEGFVDDDPHRRAHHGAMLAHLWQLTSLLDIISDQIDASPADRVAAEHRARAFRFVVATSCRDILDRFGRAFGPRPYVERADIAQRVSDVDLYIKQHHSERELGALSAGAT